MKLHIVARGRIGRSPEAELTERYLKRIRWPTTVTERAEVGGSLPAVAGRTVTIGLSEEGQDWRSADWADWLSRWRDEGIAELRVLIGAADGLTAAERHGADALVSFGRATWPHLLVRAMLAEQLYRATTILADHPYHREG